MKELIGSNLKGENHSHLFLFYIKPNNVLRYIISNYLLIMSKELTPLEKAKQELRAQAKSEIQKEMQEQAELEAKKREELEKLTPEQEAELVLIKERFPDEDISYIKGVTKKGENVVMFLKEISYELSASLFYLLKNGGDNELKAGERILLDTYIGGYNMMNDKHLKLQAVIQAISLFDFDMTVELFKKK